MTEYQPGFEEVSDEYRQFVDKFKPKKTTDDCYTPDPVFRVVMDYVARRYGVNEAQVVRPFWPGADYTHADYPPSCCVVDNPPFSIIRRIIGYYMEHGVRFFSVLSRPDIVCRYSGCDRDLLRRHGDL